MRKGWEETLYAVFMGMVIPGLILAVMVMLWGDQTLEGDMEPETANPAVSLPVLVRFESGNTEQMDMDTYLVGVVLAEMPAYFEMEALKAQAVTARTFARKAWVTGGKHGDGSVCTDFSCCQAYQDPEAYGKNSVQRENVEKVRAAVLATSGQVLTYDGELIEAVYFSCSGGKTEDAAAVWGTEYPYLHSVDSPGEENAAFYTDTRSFTPEELSEILGLPMGADPEGWFGTVTETPGGGVASMEIQGKTFTGTDLRKKLGLHSTAFSVSVEDEIILFHTRGYGHRVGMSQYGADAMAAGGADYTRILAHYYSGTRLETCRP